MADLELAPNRVLEDTPRRRLGPFAAFESVPFRYLWGNSFCFALIQSIERFAFVWLVLDLGGGSRGAGLIAFVLGIPVLFFSLPAGVMADRLDRRKLMIATQSSAAAVTGLIVLLLWTHHLSMPVMWALALCLGTTLALGMPVRSAAVPSVVPKDRLMNAIVLNAFVQNMSQIAGPAVAGAIIQVAGVQGAFMASGLLYVASAVLILPVRLPRIARPEGQDGGVREGLRFIVTHPGIRALFIFLVVASILLIGPYGVLLPQVARVRLHKQAFEASLMFTALGVGTFCSTVLQAWIGDIKRRGAVFLVVVSYCGLMLATVGLSRSYPLTIGLMFVWGLGGGFFMTMMQTLVQSNTPQEFMGRVMSVHALCMGGITPFGSLIAGAGAAAIGLVPWLGLSGATLVGLSVVIAFAQPALRRM
jgi:MFS family permease